MIYHLENHCSIPPPRASILCTAKVRWSARDSGAAKWGHFGIDFEPFLAKNGPKMAKKGPKSASSSYLSVNYAFLYIIHFIINTRFLSLKK
jgi:hypothetical protein